MLSCITPTFKYLTPQITSSRRLRVSGFSGVRFESLLIGLERSLGFVVKP